MAAYGVVDRRGTNVPPANHDHRRRTPRAADADIALSSIANIRNCAAIHKCAVSSNSGCDGTGADGRFVELEFDTRPLARCSLQGRPGAWHWPKGQWRRCAFDRLTDGERRR
ncbi:MAG: hypothetical protein BGP24_16610 [Lysobacterales bacterium 69-70]|nr:hypothetical protein [Xanthomonadaceae bacterium]ODU33610.1 MAG: hypothetical protein ABS97_11515 [Xanthomonadaceae bacterium SCN 69-320]ODV21945.1 MAG: hypothetical protein ABT27_03355 [Xanthomonadaceae bacterium SCN 69-25]OJZ02848.1 MAG: hypothetical protein BGP24_16610 [Xanthomonadales bacterium 69-70]